MYLATPKSITLTWPSARDHDVRRLQVAMDDAALVREVNRFGDLRREPHGLFARQRALAQALTQRRAIDVFHRDKRTLGVLAHLVDLADERVIESRRGLGFVQQSLSGAGVSDLGGGEELQCHLGGRGRGHAQETPRPCRLRRCGRGSGNGRPKCRSSPRAERKTAMLSAGCHERKVGRCVFLSRWRELLAIQRQHLHEPVRGCHLG